MPDGRIEPRQATRLREMGAWLKQYDGGVYGTRGGPFKPGKWGASTCKGNSIFLFVMNWPEEGELELPPVPARITAIKTLSGGTASYEQSDEAIRLTLPKANRDDIASVFVLTVDGQAFDIANFAFNLINK